MVYAQACVDAYVEARGGDLLYHAPSYFLGTEHQPELVTRLVVSEPQGPSSLGGYRGPQSRLLVNMGAGSLNSAPHSQCFPAEPRPCVFMKCKPSYMKIDTTYSVVATHSGTGVGV